jgi:hypothetical protein
MRACSQALVPLGISSYTFHLWGQRPGERVPPKRLANLLPLIRTFQHVGVGRRQPAHANRGKTVLPGPVVLLRLAADCYPLGIEAPDEVGHHLGLIFQEKMPGVQQVQVPVRQVAQIGGSPSGVNKKSPLPQISKVAGCWVRRNSCHWE